VAGGIDAVGSLRAEPTRLGILVPGAEVHRGRFGGNGSTLESVFGEQGGELGAADEGEGFAGGELLGAGAELGGGDQDSLDRAFVEHGAGSRTSRPESRSKASTRWLVHASSPDSLPDPPRRSEPGTRL
jgi:hypothetical protein